MTIGPASVKTLLIVWLSVENEAMLGSRKGINLSGVAVYLLAISAKDKADIQFAADNDLDMIFASFIRDSFERNKHILIISKIENQQGIQNLPSIIKISDGIMVARGDLDIEIPPEKRLTKHPDGKRSQYFTCQGFGHSSAHCIHQPKCVKAAMIMQSGLIPKHLTSHDCNGEHTINYDQCFEEIESSIPYADHLS
ncbi:pyruvate kinase-like [Acyrthosiphon pisum]|uniref:pyruvate kinase n=1 Tax=Acyrthosiphon pisum TaxID=7029 RepID=A0A8R2JKT4_ACYPI|nr:pyruvate kinase-like [Acyrthosiphon pisum]